ncbi:C-terminal binding protein [Terrilactibacillus laevilacticus]|uniref:C-terminal binding protein n=1 Tax=Terrilactibacillus laevilacticus TaxID=1380157 RepID=A0ABW5PV37_9BACI|nr:C-terminal binding protein [Terrilactibacillus laevilacticus]
MSRFKVMVTDYEYKDLLIEEEILNQFNIELIACQCHTEDDVIDACRNADAIINQYAPITKKVIQSLTNCKIIARYGIGVNTIDIDAATKSHIIISNVPDYCIDEVSNHAISLLLSLARKIPFYNQKVKNQKWDYKEGAPLFRLKNQTLGLVGFGRIPQLVAKKAKAFGLNILAYDPYVDETIAQERQVRLVDLNTLCRQSDFISLHAPLTNQTKDMIGEAEFSIMKKQSYLINTARGPLINESALIQAIKEKKIAGAALDVLSSEPISPDHPFLQLENVILTPHVAWYSEESEIDLRKKVAQSIMDVLHGYYPNYIVNRELYQKRFLKVK